MGFVSHGSERRVEERWSGLRVNTSSVHMVGKCWEDTGKKKKTGQTGQVQSELSATLPSMEVIKIFKMQMR